MVCIEKIVLQGFKSFKRKASIPLSSGVSVFTGPNGSGKSCIADSISFVLGISSSRSLRAKKAQDLIFHGSKNKNDSDFAHVTLHINNSKKEIPVNEREVIVSRRLNNKGVSTYRLNGEVVSRQQVVDILFTVGIRSDGHNIIKQGEVNQIVEMDPIERREILDEISGIMEFDDKKEKAEKELAKANEKIKEAEIILKQKSEMMEKLNNERAAALKYKELEALIENVKVAAIQKKFDECKGSLEDVNKKVEKKSKELEEIEKRIKEMDAEIDEEEKKFEDMTKQIIKMSDSIEITKKIERMRSELEMKRNKIESNTRQIERIDEFLNRMRGEASPTFQKIMEFSGVFGRLSDIISVPEKYSVSIEVAAGSHMDDVIVDTTETAVKCIKYLKSNAAGRARFIPLDRIASYTINPPPGTRLLSEIVEYNKKYAPAINYIFGSTVCAENIDIARNIIKNFRVRLVTLDGDLIESSGAMIGGSYRKKGTSDLSRYLDEKKRLQKEIEELEVGIININKKLEELADKEKSTIAVSAEAKRIKQNERLKKVREKRKNYYEKKLILQQELGKLNIVKAKIEAEFDNSKVQLEGMEEKKKISKEFLSKSAAELARMEKDALRQLKELGPVNLKALSDFEDLKEEFDDFKKKVDIIVSERSAIMETIEKIEAKRKETFMKTLNEINKNFKETYKELTGGDANLELEEENNINSGLLVKAQPPGKKLLNIDSLSGGEKTLTAFSFLFAIQRHKPSPFYILDEADAALDKRNTKKVAQLIRKQAKLAQFIMISHNDDLIREADQIYGVTMEDGESKVIGIKLPTKEEIIRTEQKNN